MEEDFRMTPAMQEIVLSFLTRMAFLFGEAHRDPEYQVTICVASEAGCRQSL